MSQAQNPNDKSAITFGRLLNSGFSGAQSGMNPYQSGIESTLGGITGGFRNLSDPGRFQPFIGGGEYAGTPEMPAAFGKTGYELTNMSGLAGQSKMPTDVGLGQAGLGLSGQEFAGGFDNKQMSQPTQPLDNMFNGNISTNFTDRFDGINLNPFSSNLAF